MQTVMAKSNQRPFFGLLHNNPYGIVLDKDFDDDNRKPVTTELLDWDQTRRRPALATD